jgi:hypothetical protein
MALDVIGKIVQVLDMQTGTSARGDWRKQDIILETEDQYPRKICVTLWGDRINDIAGVQIGKELLTISVTIESREFNGRWYTDVKAWKIQRAGQTEPYSPQGVAATAVPPTQQTPAASAVQTAASDNFANTEGDSLDDLPF